MPAELALLHNLLLVGAALFGVGLVGFLCRRNLIVMFLAAEMMLQGVSVSLAAWSRYRNDFGGQVLVIFIIAVAACEAAVALALVTALFRRRGDLDVAVWDRLREANQPPFTEAPLPEQPGAAGESWPTLPPAGVAPAVPDEKVDYRRYV
ncbi:MAG: NADH-quinone oxidoreductase subunit NuoK [Pirellulales bacterium]|nr:NADH-quinone oxidoreductase subunit NuoK [Pirellulales bacterium]